MDDVSKLVTDLLVVLTAGLLAGSLCKKFGVSLLVGYLLVGALIGSGLLGLVAQENHELEYLARVGALLLLFSIGIEFSFEELARLSRYFFLGGSLQMLLVAIPLFGVCLLFGMSWKSALLAGSAGALSSTVLVFKALAEWGQTTTPHGKRAIGILLFQDVALVPLMLMVPLLTNQGDPPTVGSFLLLAGKSLVFVASVLLAKRVIDRLIVPNLAGLRSVELVILFALCILGGVCWCAHHFDLPPAIGALAAGMMLSGNRLSKQIDTVILPFRETFAAVFFVTLGTLLNPLLILEDPLLLMAGLVGMLVLKGGAAAIALKSIGLSWKSALGMGMGLAQLGEFSFLILAEGVSQDVISQTDYNRMLFIALGTLILTPQLIGYGLRWTGGIADGHDDGHGHAGIHGEPIQHALVIGIGPIGRQVASRLEIMGVNVCLLDLSPIHLHDYAQQGFQTVAGDARNRDVLRRAEVARCGLVVVSVPDDGVANQIVRAIRELNTTSTVLMRCRFQRNMLMAKKAGADEVISEEVEASGALVRWCESFVRHQADAKG